MTRILLLLFLFASQLSFGQSHNNVSIFHRLIIYNADQEVLLVRFKDTNIWVTPGFYQDSVQVIKEGLHDIAASYGLTVSDPELGGVFSMSREKGERREMLVRNIYRCKEIGGELITPDFLGEAKWYPVEEALQTITYESINLFLKQIDDYPNVVWGGAVSVIMDGPERIYKITDEFYPLFRGK